MLVSWTLMRQAYHFLRANLHWPPDWKKRGRFVGRPSLIWEGVRDYEYAPDALEPFRFERGTSADLFVPSGDVIVPGEMRTDSGSLPRPLWGLPYMDPMTYEPAYLLHDWLFTAHHANATTKSFEETNLILAEAIYTMLIDGMVASGWWPRTTIYLIWEGCASEFGRKVWDGFRSV